MMKYQRILKYLESFVNYERNLPDNYVKAIKLQRVRFLFKQLSIAYEKIPAIHIAGTKGKGSTAVICAQILADSGYKVGLYTSPHLQDFRERIQIKGEQRGRKSGEWIPREDVVRIIEKFKPILEKNHNTKKYGAISFFEICTALAFQYFFEKNVDYVVLETGMGGRLDATNICRPLVSVITHIGYDHTAVLGKTLKEIAREKAGIIKLGVPVISARQNITVTRVLRKICGKQGAQLLVYDKDFISQNINLNLEATKFDYQLGRCSISDIFLRLRGAHQIENTCIAITGLIAAKIPRLAVKQGVAAANIFGRFEEISSRPLTVIDIAHNSSSFKVLSAAIKQYYPNKKVILIFAASKDKNAAEMLENITCDKIIFTSFANPRARTIKQLLAVYKKSAVLTAPAIDKAYSLAKKISAADTLIVICGSVFLAGEAKEYIQKTIP